MSIDFDSLMARQSVADIKASMIAACETVGFYVSRLPGLSRLRKMALDAVPAIVNTATAVNAEAIRGGLLDYASGVWLELLAINLFGIEAGRIRETFATTRVTFTNASAQTYIFDDDEVVVSNGAVTYKAAAFSLAATGNPGASITVDVTATVAGSSGSADAGAITTMVTTFGGVTCTNASAAVGTDEETDAQLRTRCRLSRAALSNAGHVDAIRFVALSATYEDGTPVGVTRVQVVEDIPSMGDVSVYLADADGAVSDEAKDRVDHLLRTLVIPTGVNYIDTYSATNVIVAIAHTSRFKESDGLSEEEREALVVEGLSEMFEDHPIGGYVETQPNGVMYRGEIATTIGNIQGEENGARPIKSVTVSTPSGDVALTPGQVAVRGAVTHNWVPVV